MLQFRRYLQEHGVTFLLTLTFIILVLGLGLFRITTSPGSLSELEHQALQPYGWHGFFTNPLFAPYQLAKSAMKVLVPGATTLAVRLPAVLFGLLAALAFLRVLQHWYDDRIAALTAILFVSSAGFLHTARLGTPQSIYLAVMPILLLCYCSLRDEEHPLSLIWASLAWSTLLFLPGMVWLIFLQLIWQRKEIAQRWKELSNMLKGVAVAFPVVLVPFLLFKVFTSLRLLHIWIGLPSVWEGTIIALKKIALVPVQLFAHYPEQPQAWLGHLPLLDLASFAFLIIGAAYYAKRYKASRSRKILVYLLVGGLLVGLGGPVQFAFIVPILYAIIGAGIASLLADWLKVFPRNPIARATGIACICLLIGVSCFYNLRSYFVAWPHAPATQQAFKYDT